VRSSFPLIILLSALAMGASVVRTIAQLQLMANAGGALTVQTLVLIETGNWLGWTAWAVILAAVTARLPDRVGPTAIAVRGALSLVPLVVVPGITSPWYAVVTGTPLTASVAHIIAHNLPTNLLLGIAFVAVWQGRTSGQRSRRLEQTAADLRARLAESQLAVLRAQLDPHFLFNALNSAAVLARRGDGEKVERVLGRLSALLRHSLDASRAQVVPLRVELEAVRHYVDIEQVRHGDRLRVRWDVTPGLDDTLVPSFVLQPLVENAIHHGFTDPSRALTVAVSVTGKDGRLRLTVQDDGDGLTLGEREEPVERIGLGHTRARLSGLYGEQASLVLASGPAGRGARVTIEIPGESPSTGAA